MKLIFRKCAKIRQFVGKITCLFAAFVFLLSCEATEPLLDHFVPSGSYKIDWNNLPQIDKDLRLGGFVGLYYKGDRIFYAITDRGPVLRQLNENGEDIYFLKDKFTPQVIALELQNDQTFKIVDQINIKNPFGGNTSGLPPENTWANSEIIHNQGQASDEWGLFPGGILVDVPNHFFWFADQYTPALMQLTFDGKWTKRLRPAEGLRHALANHTVNGGFTGIDFDSQGRLVAITGRCLENNRNLSDTTQSEINYRIRRVVQYNFDKNSDISMFYFVEPQSYDGISERNVKLGDIAAVNDTSYLITEFAYENGSERNLLFMAVSSDSTSKTEAGLEGILGKTFETLSEGEWRANKLVELKKTLLVDLSATNIKRPEGIAIIDNNHVAIIDNNNYGISSADPVSKSYNLEKKPIHLEIITLPKQLDIKN